MSTQPEQSRKKVRSGQCQDTEIVCWSDADEALATGLACVLDEHGHADATAVPALDKAVHTRMLKGMWASRLLDDRLMALQRQGRISHYFEARGQEAAVIAAAAALSPKDYFVPGLREGAAALFRGMPLPKYLAQILGSTRDTARGRQMPCHVSSRTIRHVSTSSCVATQIPHAVGLAWAAKIKKDPVVTLCFFGDGATSEDDFHAGMNFAAVQKVPAVFVCQNNQWAISTPVSGQTQSKTLALKGLTYGIRSIRADGNDILGLYKLISQAVVDARAGKGPTFIESLTYRVGAHASADEPSLYRDEEEAKAWIAKDPIARYAAWLDANGIVAKADQSAIVAELEKNIAAAIAAEEAVGPPPIESLFDDVSSTRPWHVEEQKADLLRQKRK